MKPTLHTVWLVARRELLIRVRTRAFLLGTLLMALLVLAFPVVMFFASSSAGDDGSGPLAASEETTRVGVTPSAAGLAGPLEREAGVDEPAIEVREVADTEAGKTLVREGELDGVVAGTPTEPELFVEQHVFPNLETALTTITYANQLDAEMAENGLDPDQLRDRAGQGEVAIISMGPSPDASGEPMAGMPDAEKAQRLVIAMISTFLLYMFLIMTGQMIAQGVVEEKSSRVVEVLLSTIRSTELMAGKIVGIGLTGLIQFAVVGILGFAAATTTAVLTLPTATVAGLLGWAVLWFLLGFTLYATMLAAAASLVSRQEDLQSVITPVIMLLIVPFVVGVSVLPTNPEGTTGTVLSMIPGFSPMLMPMRLALGEVPLWQGVLSVVLSLAASAVVLWLGGRIYSNAVLRTGARVRFKDALRAS
ncbi:ABC transporter permease [Actinopolyspora erythraea]|uniref:ABC transporter permease n=1 Tax=Actinopolyspora erythraea TaxID=414996 RepID=A0A099D4U1_9ACTN|nr:ABC transporter permease [Actinopolyspora erythraea]ASU77428.1 ABC transporter permease [Actinopolyspora erythraea]KGI80360.1 ABC transporter permease [Actinopolyspora erythraea]